MGAVHSRTSRAAERDAVQLAHVEFGRALRKQDRRLERDAAALRRRRGADSGLSRRRERDERRNVNDGDDGIVAREATGLRRETNERDPEKLGDDVGRRRRTRASEEMRALRLECARREAKARQRREAEREKRRADRKERAPRPDRADGETEGARRGPAPSRASGRRRGDDDDDDENENDATAENGSRFDELLAACAADETAARHSSRRRRERERRREASGRRASGETSPGDEDERSSENDASSISPCDALPFAAAAAAAAADERRTGSLNPPGLSRGGLKRKYEQVKVFRNGDSLFQCAFLAELVSRHEDDVFEDDAELKAFDRRDRAAARRAETVAAVLRRGIRALGSADTHETTLALRAGAASRIAEAHVDARADGAPPGANPPPTLRDDFDVDAIDAAVVTAVNGAELLNKNMRLCPPRGAPLDTWRRAMNEVGRRAEAELSEEAADALLDDDERLESDDESLSRADDEASRLERRAAFESAVRNVRRAYADEVARARVPSSSLEVAALAAHLRRPIAVIRGPSRPPRAATKKAYESNPSDDDVGAAHAAASPASAWRARCASETFGAAHARRGRRGFTVFWELAENVPDGLPAGDFSLLLPRRETHETHETNETNEPHEPRVEGRERFSFFSSRDASRGRRRSFAASDDDRFSRSVSSFVASSEEEEEEYSCSPNARATFSDADTLTDDADVSDADVSSVSSVDDLLRGHAARSRRFAESGFWSDRTPLASDSDTGGSTLSVSGESLWNSESERSFDLGSESERDGERRAASGRDAPSFLSGDEYR